MQIQYPHTIENGHGEILTFDTVEHEPDGDRVVGENWVQPGFGPPMHTHFLQDEVFTVVSGKIGSRLRRAMPGVKLSFRFYLIYFQAVTKHTSFRNRFRLAWSSPAAPGCFPPRLVFPSPRLCLRPAWSSPRRAGVFSPGALAWWVQRKNS